MTVSCEDIENRRCNFIGQTNHVLCYFGKLDSVTKHKLFETGLIVVACTAASYSH